jgi:hypothetical protein
VPLADKLAVVQRLAGFITDDVLLALSADKPFWFGKSLSNPIQVNSYTELFTEISDVSGKVLAQRHSFLGLLAASRVSANGRHLVVCGGVYDTTTGEALVVPRGQTVPPEMSQFTEDGRFGSFPDARSSYVFDLAADKRIVINANADSDTGKVDFSFLKDIETWIAMDLARRIVVLRKSDASLDAELLRRWCQVVTRGKLDESGRFNGLDEATWERERLELARRLDMSPNAQSLRSAVRDPHYWLRQEINSSSAPLPLLDRLVAAEPTWPNYAQRAAAHEKERHWNLAIRDELEAARLAGDRYWLGGSRITGYDVAFRVVQTPDQPREQYESALKWVNARIQADVEQGIWRSAGSVGSLPRTLIPGIALRLGRHADALAALRGGDVPLLTRVSGLLMSPWNLLTMVDQAARNPAGGAGPLFHQFRLDPVDLLVRAMCHHHLGHPKEAQACLHQARAILAKSEKGTDAVGFLHEAESLIEGKPGP